MATWFRRLSWSWFTTLFLVVVALVLATPATATPPKHYTDLTFAPLPPLQIPAYVRFTMDNGLVVYLMEDHELPLVEGRALFRAGSRWDPADQVGLAEMTGELLRLGGTRFHPSEELNLLLEDRAAAIESGIGLTQGTVSFQCLREDLPQVMGLFGEVIQAPAFAPEQVELVKVQVEGGLARRNDNPGAIAQREFRQLLYGRGSPYAREVDQASLERISRRDIEAYYQKTLRPENMILGLVGDFDPVEMGQLIQGTLGAWSPPPTDPLPPIPPIETTTSGGVFWVDQPQLSQSFVRLGQLGGTYRDPDLPALSVMNELLNGFGGRLFDNVRSRQGLAYSVYGLWGANYDYPGLFVAGGETRGETSVPFIQAIRREIDRLRRETISPADLQFAKDSVLNAFVFNFQEPSQTLTRLMTYEYFGYPADFLQRYRRAIEATTRQDVQQAAQKHLDPDHWVTLVVGNGTLMDPPLEALTPTGAVTPLDISLPSLPPAAAS